MHRKRGKINDEDADFVLYLHFLYLGNIKAITRYTGYNSNYLGLFLKERNLNHATRNFLESLPLYYDCREDLDKLDKQKKDTLIRLYLDEFFGDYQGDLEKIVTDYPWLNFIRKHKTY